MDLNEIALGFLGRFAVHVVDGQLVAVHEHLGRPRGDLISELVERSAILASSTLAPPGILKADTPALHGCERITLLRAATSLIFFARRQEKNSAVILTPS